jgi:hypothetical protein
LSFRIYDSTRPNVHSFRPRPFAESRLLYRAALFRPLNDPEIPFDCVTEYLQRRLIFSAVKRGSSLFETIELDKDRTLSNACAMGKGSDPTSQNASTTGPYR